MTVNQFFCIQATFGIEQYQCCVGMEGFSHMLTFCISLILPSICERNKEQRQSLFSGMDYWNGLLEWTTGMDYWNAL